MDELLLVPMPVRVERRGAPVAIERVVTVGGADAGLVSQTLGARGVALDSWDSPPAVVCRVETGSGGADVPPIGVAEQRYALVIDGAVGDESRGVIRANGPSPITIRANSRAGLRHALHTLRQLIVQFPERLPGMWIDDGPSFATRGVMLDVSRDRVPTMEQLYQTVDLLAGLKYNHLQLYTEHTFAYKGHEEVWREWSPLTGDEVRRLDRYCRLRGVELAANQNCFGHLVKWLEHQKYADLAETHGDWMFDVWPRKGAFSLCPTDPRSLELVKDLLGQLLPNFSSPRVNIGCDETYDIAYGRSKAEVERRGRPAVYMEFVRKVCDAARGHGKRAQFWADIALSHPECVKDIPEDVCALAWGYEPDAKFAEWCEVLRAAGREVWVCPGTSSWRSITGRTAERVANVNAAAKQGSSGGASGMLICDWGDTGHQQQWPLTMHALAHGAQAAWNAEACEQYDGRAGSLQVFGDRTLSTCAWLDELGDADRELRAVAGRFSRPEKVGEFPLRNSSAVFFDLQTQVGERLEVGAIGAWEETLKRIVRLAERVPRGVAPLVADELSHACEVARLAAGRAAARRRPGGLEDRFRRVLAERLRGVMAEHERLWRMRSRDGGLGHSVGYYGKVLRELDGG